MQAEIYADIVFVVNFFMDFFILFVTGKLYGKKTVLWRLVIAALLAAALYCLLLFIPALFRYYNFFTAICVIIPSVYIAFLPKSIREYAKLMLFMHISAFAIGGGGMALFYFTNTGIIFGNAIQFAGKHFSIYILVFTTCISYILLKFVQKRMQIHCTTRQAFCTVKVFYDNEAAELRALIDTGNTLVEPISKNPVVIAEFTGIKKCLPQYIRRLFDENKQDDLEALLECTNGTPFSGRIRMIPFQSVGAKKVLIGFRPDKIEIHTDKSVFTKNAVIGIYNINLTSDHEYNALLNPVLINDN